MSLGHDIETKTKVYRDDVELCVEQQHKRKSGVSRTQRYFIAPRPDLRGYIIDAENLAAHSAQLRQAMPRNRSPLPSQAGPLSDKRRATGNDFPSSSGSARCCR
jgi:hypothetical protein